MGMFVPNKIKIELTPETINLIKYVVDKIDVWWRNSIFWRTK